MRLRRVRSNTTTVATINGWDIVREAIGASVVWHANACDAEGYRIQDETFTRRRDAETWAKVNAVPPPVPPTAEVLAIRRLNEATMARHREIMAKSD